ncbi:MAG: hypothetical protein LBU32_06755 [Clostridiales bacterium]|nr:hypothetical protein [Clostridiales bacterium]
MPSCSQIYRFWSLIVHWDAGSSKIGIFISKSVQPEALLMKKSRPAHNEHLHGNPTEGIIRVCQIGMGRVESAKHLLF